ncbi:STT3 domain-containing protein [Halomicrobium salinisoli]|uniref:STT3 domain-containing protein n=1 Tax=Halomicrobium salinisoli TaxID=2878391 RepID=UPI001CF033B4|nr:STT3 domain-containing protein [Halomicrobium salinisoli]
MTEASEVRDLLDDRPDLADPLADVLAVDAERDRWTFDDVPIDSGAFGELVARDIVEGAGDEYRLADPAAVRAALEGDAAATANGAGAEAGRPSADFSAPSIGERLGEVDWTVAGFVSAALAFVALVRVHPITAIYRDGNVVLSGNDPYAYRYYVEQVLASSQSLFDLSALSELPGSVVHGEPLTLTALWWTSELLGGDPEIASHVLAWYPVVSAVVTGAVVYLLATTLTRDRRVGLAAVLLFALVPGHAMRTSLGFADHHAFDYPWLAATALALTYLAGVDRESLRAPRTWLASLGLGVAVAGQVLSWEAGPLLIAAVGLAVVGLALAAVARDEPPVPAIPIVAGLGLGSVLAAVGHVVVGWHTARVAFSPTLVLAGVAAVFAAAALVRRTTGDARHLAAVYAVLAPVGLAALRFGRPDDWAKLVEGIQRLTSQRNIAETTGLFDPDSLGVLLLLGLTFVVAAPAMAWGIHRSLADRRWTVVTAYAWYFLGLSALSIRFVGEFAPFVAVFAGVAFVWTADWIDAIRPFDPDAPGPALEIPDRKTLVTVGVLFLLVASLGAIQVPVKTSQLLVTDAEYGAAMAAEERSDRLDQQYPENYVLSSWGSNRMYNYFVSGDSQRYAYARQHYPRLLTADHPDDLYDRFSGRVGYVVVPGSLGVDAETPAYDLLARDYGSRTAEQPGTAHYRALWASPDDERRVFAVVPGANVTGSAAPNATVTLRTNVSVPGAEFTYERQTSADASGSYAVRVANPGTYTVATDNGTRQIEVAAGAVRNGTAVGS